MIGNGSPADSFEFCSPAFALDLAAALVRLDGMERVRQIGQGSIGTVDELRCSRTGISFAVKSVDLNELKDATGNDNNIKQRAANESKIAVRLLDDALLRFASAHLVQYHACLRVGQQLKLVMQLVPGPNLHTVLRQRGHLPESEARNVAGQLAAALAALHGAGLVYVDLKAENVLLQEDGTVTLCDFDLCLALPSNPAASTAGCSPARDTSPCWQASRNRFGEEVASAPPAPAASAFEHPAAATGSGRATGTELPSRFWGTAEYAAPEVIKHGCAAYSVHSDWWSLGVLTYEMLFGRTPFFAEGNQEQTFYNITMRAPTVPETPACSAAATTFVRALLRQNVEYRLGSRGPQEVLSHPFLAVGV